MIQAVSWTETLSFSKTPQEKKAAKMSGTIEDIAKKWLAEPAYNKVFFFLFYWGHPHIYEWQLNWYKYFEGVQAHVWRDRGLPLLLPHRDRIHCPCSQVPRKCKLRQVWFFWQKYWFVNISIFRFLTSLGSGEVVCAIKGLVVEISHQTAAIKALEKKRSCHRNILVLEG